MDGLEPDSQHSITVRSVLSDGTESTDSNLVVARTLPPRVVSMSELLPSGPSGTERP